MKYITLPLAGPTKPKRLDDAIATLNITLRDGEIAKLETACTPDPVVSFR